MHFKDENLGHYRILHLISHEDSGSVYLATDEKIGRQVVIKIVQINCTETSSLFDHKAKIIAKLDHPHILPLFDFGKHDSQNEKFGYLVLPYRQERSLENWLKSKKECLLPQETGYVIDQMAQALQYAHDNELIHGDIKLSNFLVRSSASTVYSLHLELTGFSFAKINTRSSSNPSDTDEYRAPEQREGELPNQKADQYALAVVAYKLLTGTFPENKDQPIPPSSLNSIIDPKIHDVIRRALAKNPEERFSTVSDFAHEFNKAANQETVMLDNSVIIDGPRSQPGHKNDGTPLQQEIQSDPTPPHYIPPEGETLLPLTPHPDHQLNPNPPMQPNKPTRNQYIITITLIAIASLLILPGAVFAGFSWKTNIDYTNATATTNANNATLTSFAHATSTAHATAIANATAFTVHNETATAIGNASHYPFSYELQPQHRDVFTDLYKQSPNLDSWDDNDQCKLSSAGYLVNSSGLNHITKCFAENTNFSNFTYEVHFQIIKGDCAGIIFRASLDENNFYTFIICQNAFFLFVSSVNGSLINPSKTGSNLAIYKGNNSYNTIGVVARGNTLSFYVIRVKGPPVLIHTAIDNNYKQGRIGVIVNSIHNATQVLFIGAKLWTL